MRIGHTKYKSKIQNQTQSVKNCHMFYYSFSSLPTILSFFMGSKGTRNGNTIQKGRSGNQTRHLPKASFLTTKTSSALKYCLIFLQQQSRNMDNNGLITLKMRTLKFLANKICWALLHCFLTCFLVLASSDESSSTAKDPHLPLFPMSEYPFYTTSNFIP